MYRINSDENVLPIKPEKIIVEKNKDTVLKSIKGIKFKNY
jgi:hypothetical protein